MDPLREEKAYAIFDSQEILSRATIMKIENRKQETVNNKQ